MFRKITIVCFIIFISLNAFSQIEISGIFPGGVGHEINIHGPLDLISQHQKKWGSQVINDTSGFSINIPLNHRIPINLEVGFYTYQFMAIPGKQYFFISDTLSLDDVYRPFYIKEDLPCRITELPAPQVNHILFSFNGDFNDFILANFGGIYENRRAGLFSPFKVEMQQKLDSINDPFIQAYVDYKIALAEWAVIPQKKTWFFNTYIKEKPILYNNPEYLNFIESYYDDIPNLNNRFVQRSVLINGINYSDNYSVLLDHLGEDTLLRNEQIRELVMLFTLKALFNNPDFSKAQINTFFSQIQQESKFKEHREIAGNLKPELNAMQKGTRVNNFRLMNLNGDSLSLDELVGKPVYLGFFTSWSYACLAELEGMQKLYEIYGSQIHFISIILDEKTDVARRLIQEKNYRWPFLYNGTHFDLLSDYRVKTFPSFLLLDEQLNVFQYPAYKPSEVIEGQFKQLLSPIKE